jgi:PAS domain S-box-containing protein
MRMILNEPTRIILIEDDRVAQLAFRRLMREDLPDLEATIVSSVGEAREVLRSKPFDVIVTDYLLGDGNAFEIMEMDEVRHIPIIFITGAGDEAIAVKALRLGAYDYLIKDLRGNYLKLIPATVENALERKRMEQQSRMLSLAMRDISDAVFIINAKGQIIFVNHAFVNTYGYRMEHILGKTIETLWAQALPSEQEIHENPHDELLHQRSNGDVFPVLLCHSPIMDDEGLRYLDVYVARDITEKKKDAQALQNSEIRYRVLFNKGNDAIFLHEVGSDGLIGNLVEVNDVACASLGCSRSELLSQSCNVETPPDHINDFNLTEKLQEKGQLRFETFWEPKGRERRIVEVNAHLFSLDGKDMVLSRAYDITERKQTEDLLFQSQERYRHLFETALVGMFRTRIEDGQFLLVNQTFLRLLGYNPETEKERSQLLETICAEAVFDPDVYEELVRQLRKKGEISNYEATIHQPEGNILQVLLNTRLYPEEGVVEGTVIDISKQKEVESALRDALSEKEMLQDQIVQSSKMAAIGEMAAGMAHELNQGIAAIMSFAQGMLKLAIQDDFRKDRFERNLEYIVNLTKKTADIINELRSFARPSKKDYSFVLINKVVHEAMIIIKENFRSEGIDVLFELDQTLPMINGNANQLEQVIVNFLNNSKDAMDTGQEKQITIRTYTKHNLVFLEVIDTGKGMPSDVKEKIFIPFYTTKDREKGTGLGLSICYKIIQEHKGTIKVESEIGKGTMFQLQFPAV